MADKPDPPRWPIPISPRMARILRGMTFEQKMEYVNALRDEYRASVRAREAEEKARQARGAREALEKKGKRKLSAGREPWEEWYDRFERSLARMRRECEARKRKML